MPAIAEDKKAKKREYDKAYRKAHHEFRQEQGKTYRLTHKEQISKRMKKYNAIHPARNRENAKRWRIKKHEHYIEQNKKWTKEHPEQHKAIANRCRRNHLDQNCKRNCEWIKKHPGQKAIDTARRKARKLNAEGNGIAREEWLQMCSENAGKCSYCGQKKPLTMEHVVPLVSGGKHDVTNIVPACKSCNSSKKEKSFLMYLYQRSI